MLGYTTWPRCVVGYTIIINLLKTTCMHGLHFFFFWHKNKRIFNLHFSMNFLKVPLYGG